MLSLETARSWYPSADPTHGFDHIVRVYHLAERLARAENADLEIVCAAALLHDAEPPHLSGPASRATHQQASASFARQVLLAEGWPEARIAAVEHAIRAHRFRDRSEEPHTLEAQVLFDADKLDAIGAIGAARALGYAFSHGQPAFAEPSAQFLESGLPLAGEAHSAYHEHVFKLRHIEARLYTASGRSLARERHALMCAFFDQLAAEHRGQA